VVYKPIIEVLSKKNYPQLSNHLQPSAHSTPLPLLGFWVGIMFGVWCIGVWVLGLKGKGRGFIELILIDFLKG